MALDHFNKEDGSAESVMRMLEIEEELEDVITLEHGSALFECKIVQNFKPKYTWHKDGSILQSDKRISITQDGAWFRLEIKRVTASDQGIYTIECRHNETHISLKAHLFVAPRNINGGVFYNKLKHRGSAVEEHLRNVRVPKGKTIVMEAKFRYESEQYIWFKNNDVILYDQRTIIHNLATSSSITIIDAKPTDTGVYFIVAKTEQGFISSFADVQVGDANEKQHHIPSIEHMLPDDLEGFVGEEMRLFIKADTDTHTKVKWSKNNVEINQFNKDFIQVDYGNNYFGLTIPNPLMSSAGDYLVKLMNDKMERVICMTGTRLTFNPSPLPPPKVNLIRPLESAVACCGSKVTFDCGFDLKDPLYYYVVWYVGHYKVERTNSLFNVLCGGGQYILYIKKLEPSMAGEVICELRKACPNRKSVMIKRAYANLVMVPLPLIIEAKTRPVYESKLYDRHAVDFCIRIEEDADMEFVADNVAGVSINDCLLKIVYCRLDEDGLNFLHATRGQKTSMTTRLGVYERLDTNGKITVIKWNDCIVSTKVWYSIELGQANGTFAKAGITSRPFFEVENPPLDRIMFFRIRAVEAMSQDFDSEIYIVPPPEILTPLPISHEIQSMDSFTKQYTKTNDIIGAGAFGSVVLVRDNIRGSDYAAKFVKARTGKKRDHVLKEFHIMKNLHHPKLIELMGFYESKITLVFVMEYCWGGELFERVVGEEYLKEVDVVGYVKQICEGLEYMHKNGIVHLDLKPENIICLSPNSRQVKLIDFGLARNVSEDFSRAIYGTRDYMAPEVIDFEPITTASDMWSLGVVTYTLLSGLMPFSGGNWIENSVNITRAMYNYEDFAFNEVSDLAKDFVDHLLLRLPRKRMSATEALNKKWIQEGPPQGSKAKHMTKMRQNLKSYLAVYRLRWQRAGNVLIAAHRLRMKTQQEQIVPGLKKELIP